MRQEYSIVARRGKKGLTYYVRYFVENKMIPSQWSTHTDILQEAKNFSEANKEKILKRYFSKKEGRTLYSIMGKYYEENSSYLVIDAARGRKLSETSRKILHGFILHRFIPFLRENKIKELGEINASLLNRFQNHLLLGKKLLPQSINRQISGIKAIFSHLYMTGVIEQNSIKDIVPLRPRNNKIRDCYSLDELAGVFKTKWEDEKSYLLCSLIYSAGLRNSEIRNLRAKDIIHKGGIDFVNIEKSKTQNGIRIIPLHRRLKESLDEWIQNHDLSENDYLFIKRHGQRFDKSAKKAHDFLASRLDRDIPGSEDKSISFYSGRHFYKTMLNNRGLGDIEEMFMGHKVNKNIGDRYNHKNKRGEQELLKKAKKALEIIDECLYR